MQEGLKAGIEKGVLKEKIEVAKKLLNANISIDLIITTTGLNVKDIEALLQKK